MNWRILSGGIISLFVLCTAGAASQVQSNPLAATVSGTVVNQVTGAPVPNVVVTFTPGQGAPVTVRTSAAGAFQSTLVAQRYTISLTHDSLVLARQSSGPFNLTLAPGQNLAELRYEMTALGSIAGRVLTDDGEPRAGVMVAVAKLNSHSGRSMVVPDFQSARTNPAGSIQKRTLTNDLGYYRLFGLEPGGYYVGVWPGGPPPQDLFAPEFYPGVLDPDDGVQVVVQPGATQESVDFRLMNRAAYALQLQISDLPPPPLTGNMPLELVPDSLVLQAFHVVRLGRTVETLIYGTENRLRTSSVAAGGDERTIVIPALPTGNYRVYYTNSVANGPVASTEFSITSEDVQASLQVQPHIRLTGQVSMADAVLPAFPLDRLLLCLRPTDYWASQLANSMSVLRSDLRCIQIGRDGSFRAVDDASVVSPATVLPELSPRDRYVELLGLPADVYVASIRYEGREIQNGVLEMAGPPAGPLEITLETPGASVEGIVRNAMEEPVVNGRVVLVPEGNRRLNPTMFHTATTDQRGAFSIRGVAPGNYGVLAWEYVEPDAFMNPEFLSRHEVRAERITVQNGMGTNVTVRVIP